MTRVFGWVELKEGRSSNWVWGRRRGVCHFCALTAALTKKNDMKNQRVTEEKVCSRILHKDT